MIEEKGDEESIKRMKAILAKKGISDCSAIGQAKYECSKINYDADTKEYKMCVLSISNTISARMAADEAARQASMAADDYEPEENSTY